MSFSPPNRLPEALARQYEAQERLAHHPGKETWLARDRLSGKNIIIKLLFFGANFDWQNHKLFEREAKVLQSLNHPSIPKHLDSIEFHEKDRTGFALVQSYIEGCSLSEHLNNGRVFSEADLKQLARQLLEILIFLHGCKPPVIHRDIKPSNVMLSDRSGHSLGTAYLVDFGAVQTTSVPGRTRTVVGTYGYMPPEQFGERTVLASDLYSLGATLIFLATGQHPADLPQDNLKLQFEPLVRMTPDLVLWINQLIEPSLDQRFSSAEQALAALDNPAYIPSQSSTLAKPQYSRIKLIKKREQLNLTIPASGFQPQLILLIPFAIAWNSFIIYLFPLYASAPFPGNLWFLLFSLPICIGISMIWLIFFTIFGQYHLQINSTKISQTYQLFGLKIKWPRPSSAQDIDDIEFIDVHWRTNSNGQQVKVPHRLIITAGPRTYQVGALSFLQKREIRWLAQELSTWLKLPLRQ